MSATDEELLDAWRDGDDEAGTTLFRRYFDPCRRFFVNKVPERDVDDLLQRTFMGMVEARHRYRGDAPFRAFLFSIARHVLLRHLRDFARKDSRCDPDLGISSIAMLGVTPGTALALEHEHEVVRRALQRIPVHYQTIIELSYWEEMSTPELAAALEIEPTTVRTRLFRARKALAKALEGSVVRGEDAVDEVTRALGREL